MPTKRPARDHYVKDGELIEPLNLALGGTSGYVEKMSAAYSRYGLNETRIERVGRDVVREDAIVPHIQTIQRIRNVPRLQAFHPRDLGGSTEEIIFYKYREVHKNFMISRGKKLDLPGREEMGDPTPEDRQRWKDSGLYEGETNGATREGVDDRSAAAVFIRARESTSQMEDDHQRALTADNPDHYDGLLLSYLSNVYKGPTAQEYEKLKEDAPDEDPGSVSRRGYDRILGRYENPPSPLFEEFRTTLTGVLGTTEASQLLDMPENFDELTPQEKDKIVGPSADPLVGEQKQLKSEQLAAMMMKQFPGYSDIMEEVSKHLANIKATDGTLARAEVEREATLAALPEDGTETASREDGRLGSWGEEEGGDLGFHDVQESEPGSEPGSYFSPAAWYNWARPKKQDGGRYKKRKRRTKKRRTKKRRTKKRSKRR